MHLSGPIWFNMTGALCIPFNVSELTHALLLPALPLWAAIYALPPSLAGAKASFGGHSKVAQTVSMQELLIQSVVKRLMSDAPLGVLLSGGLDSSLVAAIAMRCALHATSYAAPLNMIATPIVVTAGSPHCHIAYQLD